MYKVVSYSLTYFLIDCIFLAIDNCTVSMCGNGTCKDGIDTFTCNCNENFFGAKCEPAKGKQITIVSYLQICLFLQKELIMLSELSLTLKTSQPN